MNLSLLYRNPLFKLGILLFLVWLVAQGIISLDNEYLAESLAFLGLKEKTDALSVYAQHAHMFAPIGMLALLWLLSRQKTPEALLKYTNKMQKTKIVELEAKNAAQATQLQEAGKIKQRNAALATEVDHLKKELGEKNQRLNAYDQQRDTVVEHVLAHAIETQFGSETEPAPPIVKSRPANHPSVGYNSNR